MEKKERRQQICEADARIRKAEAVWDITETYFPDPDFDEAALRANMETNRLEYQRIIEWDAYMEAVLERARATRR